MQTFKRNTSIWNTVRLVANYGILPGGIIGFALWSLVFKENSWILLIGLIAIFWIVSGFVLLWLFNRSKLNYFSVSDTELIIGDKENKHYNFEQYRVQPVWKQQYVQYHRSGRMLRMLVLRITDISSSQTFDYDVPWDEFNDVQLMCQLIAQASGTTIIEEQVN
ncbi:hypothetical protein [Culicoidibacter larvae]|uniref:Uncharacterized protein n=1 Tax=Culicoidibacter larvae TaxID=2579976 RepID=A0A5R8QAS2_9FIRM|nr:hypothetical protein [Culicoidibacter larvae]TLG72957.1 hypothetical protein FEZ08_07875 [Culicoidibacter larvae]